MEIGVSELPLLVQIIYERLLFKSTLSENPI